MLQLPCYQPIFNTEKLKCFRLFNVLIFYFGESFIQGWPLLISPSKRYFLPLSFISWIKYCILLYQQVISGDQVAYRMAIQNNVLCRWATLKHSQNTYRQTCCSKRQKSRWISFNEYLGPMPFCSYIVQCHGLSHGRMRVSSRPKECEMTCNSRDWRVKR